MTLKHTLLQSTQHLQVRCDLKQSVRTASRKYCPVWLFAEQFSLQKGVPRHGVEAEAQQCRVISFCSLLLTSPEPLHCKQQFSSVMAMSL